jgi:hypothetical protein
MGRPTFSKIFGIEGELLYAGSTGPAPRGYKPPARLGTPEKQIPTPGTEPGRKPKEGTTSPAADVIDCLFLLHAGGNEEELCTYKPL